MDNDFEIGDWVVYVNQGHSWHGMSFKITEIELDANFERQYKLEYGRRVMLAEGKNLLRVRDYTDKFDFQFKVEDDNKCRHTNKVRSHALGEYFWYCRDCKQEV